ncbi:MAG: recombinase family protein [Pseudomonadota bacterium]
MNKIRCAIYTRKSTEDGLDQAFNSLDAQREACEAYVASQKHEGWKLLKTHYDDGGKSGGNLERPALQQLLAEIEAGQGGYDRRLQDRSIDAFTHRFRQTGGTI